MYQELYISFTPNKNPVKWKKKTQKFPSGPMVRPLCFHCRGHTFDPSVGSQDPICRVEGPKIKLKKRKKRGRAGLFKI